MALVVWPDAPFPEGPYCLAEGFEETAPNLVIRSEVDGGPAKQRRVSTGGPSLVKVSYLVTSAVRDYLWDFYQEQAAGGAIWFEWPHPVLLEARLARFIEGQPPSYQPYKPDWLWSQTLEVRPRW